MELGRRDRDAVEERLVAEDQPERHDGDRKGLDLRRGQVAGRVRDDGHAAARDEAAQVLLAHVLDLRLLDAPNFRPLEDVLGTVHVEVERTRFLPPTRQRVAERRRRAAQGLAVDPVARDEDLGAVTEENRGARLPDSRLDDLARNARHRLVAAPAASDLIAPRESGRSPGRPRPPRRPPSARKLLRGPCRASRAAGSDAGESPRSPASLGSVAPPRRPVADDRENRPSRGCAMAPRAASAAARTPAEELGPTRFTPLSASASPSRNWAKIAPELPRAPEGPRRRRAARPPPRSRRDRPDSVATRSSVAARFEPVSLSATGKTLIRFSGSRWARTARAPARKARARRRPSR